MDRPARFSLAIGVGAKLTSRFEARQVIRRAAALMALGYFAGGCGSWQRVGRPDAPPVGTTLPRLSDATSVYRSMGLLVGGGSLPFIASVRYLAGPTPDSTLALFAVSLTNQAITFQRRGNEFVAEYRVEAAFRTDTGAVPVRLIARDEQVRVRSFRRSLTLPESSSSSNSSPWRPQYRVSERSATRTRTGLRRAEPDGYRAASPRAITLPIAVYWRRAGRSAPGCPLGREPRPRCPTGGLDPLLHRGLQPAPQPLIPGSWMAATRSCGAKPSPWPARRADRGHGCVAPARCR